MLTCSPPLLQRFSVKQRKNDSPSGVGDYCILVDMEAGTVFRFNDPLDEDIATLLQVRAMYCCSAFGMPATVLDEQTSPRSMTATGMSDNMTAFSAIGKKNPAAGADEMHTSLLYKEGKSWMLFEKDMRSTKRDWHDA